MRATAEVDWILQESYGRAVRLAGITDWSKFTGRDYRHMTELVEDYQLRIAGLIQKALHS